MTVAIFAASISLAGLIAVVVLLFRQRAKLRRLESRFAPILDIDAEVARLISERDRLKIERSKEEERYTAEQKAKRESLEGDYKIAFETYTKLKTELESVEETSELQSVGLYKPHFEFSDTEQYKAELLIRREKVKAMAKADRAAYCSQTWTVNNSAREGQRMVRLYKKLMLRAFNGECDAALADVGWNNVTRIEERVRKAFKNLNELGAVIHVRIYDDYLEARLEEIWLKNDYEQKRYEEREEQRRIREQIREEERAQREFEQARIEAEQDENKYAKALETARQQAEAAVGEKLQRLISQVAGFEAKLDEARKKKERAIARAELTKSGFVYVISNLGSFGERVFKIGMTRRLEPMDRIHELSGAAVPFPYDLHAMLWSDNAPELEAALHRLFSGRRLNLVNPRREFYWEIELDEIEAFVRERGLSAQFIKVPEAREYRQTLSLREKNVKPTEDDIIAVSPFPAELFSSADQKQF